MQIRQYLMKRALTFPKLKSELKKTHKCIFVDFFCYKSESKIAQNRKFDQCVFLSVVCPF